MFTCTRTLHRNGSIHQAMMKGLGIIHLFGTVGFDKDKKVEIAVADVTDNRCNQAAVFDIPSGIDETLRKTRDWDTHIRHHRPRTRAERNAGIERVVPGVPARSSLVTPKSSDRLLTISICSRVAALDP